jgi:glycosyltransferase involved in cell wall biosynthesis
MARICMVAFTHYSIDTRVRREAEALADRGDEVDVVCLSEEKLEKSQVLDGVRLYQVPIGRYRGSSAATYLLKYVPFLLAASFRLTCLHLKKRYQVIQVHTMPDFMVFAALVPKLLGAKVILDVHDLMPELYQSRFGFKRSHWLIRLVTWVERRSVGFADRAIAVHRPHLDTLVRHGNPAEKFTILLNVPDPRIFSKHLEAGVSGDGRFRLIYHGTVARRHGLQVVLRALPKIRQEIRHLEFQVFGEGDAIPYLLHLTRELDVADCVTINRGMMPVDQLVPIILRADVGVVPILYDDFTKHMLPVKLLEYAALGIPVVTSETETIKTYFDDSMVQYCKPGDADDLAEKILDLYRNPAKRQRLAANAARFNRDYGWEQQRQLYYKLIDDLCGRD